MYPVLNILNLTLLSLLLDFNFLADFIFFFLYYIDICSIFHWKAPWGRGINVFMYLCSYCVRRRRTLPNFVGLLWTLANSLRVFLGYRAGSYDVTFSLRKGFCPRATQNSVFFANIGRTSGVGRRVVEEFRSCVSTNFLLFFVWF